MMNFNAVRRNDADTQTDELLKLIDFTRMNSLFAPFVTATGLPVRMTDVNGTVLASSNCLTHCTESDSYLVAQFSHAAPVVVEGCHLANVCIVKPGDIDSITEEKLPALVTMLASWTQQIVTQNLAEQLAIAKAERTVQEKNAFIAHISHKLRSPLNAVMGFAQLILHADNLPDEHYENAGIIYNSGTHLLTIINNAVLNPEERETEKQTPTLLTTQHFQIMPAEWIAQLHDALLEGETAQLMVLIQNIPSAHAFLIEQLTALVREFQFESILDFIVPIVTSKH